jgi:ubiquinone/menaquinone biosynthesis C-methylase UbiE
MKDNFSKQAEVYAKYRPGYPPELYDFVLTHVYNKSTAWDCATGNGQTAIELAKHFKKVFATDISQKQIDNALHAKNIFYSLQAAEHTNFEENIFDLVTVSQALHWLNMEKFYVEVKRVTKPGGWIAVWMYSLCNISSEIDELINEKHYRNTLGAYWDYERKYVDDCYATLSFPFSEIKSPIFQIVLYWTMDELSGYLNSWSALQKFIATKHYNPVDELMIKIKPWWKEEKMKIVFPLYLRMGQVEK